MPLNSYTAWMVSHATRRHGMTGDIGFLGRMWPSSLTYAEYQTLAEKWGWTELIGRQDYPPGHIMTDKELCALLGYRRALAVDFTADEGAEVVLDMNQPLPAQFHETLDVVYNNGTLEHIFHVPNVLENIAKFLRKDGYVIHSSPANNQVEHGFYQFSPTLFYDYYSANDWKVCGCWIVQHRFLAEEQHSFRLIPFDTYAHPPDDGEPLYGKLDNLVYDVVFIAQKQDGARGDVIPTQFRYAPTRQ